ncbi:hypothetical protein A2627_02725 [Candidatus Woesebacteria bacterium RIFCSPHIGHO2_01_FULL_39_28]|uniref:DNA polymerase III delta N-terminal domain-containing protein n=1 Tax=Candidatus Woesebacteria bacterium RIFCSPHIGHO2_01_FULL_39_28 TaxID=1802496 RepID=A0A1F7YCR8_9BACT|nr:MAG: hypothetical protein A2627_02725 [Candidatus Woesebacteria bacterium RIFCSPHIGHO2_01_FULL_39_28]OGM58417.1 MAG: hypothetical protein A3A50_02650 [Candidatus Woesebacteria bacterium RIFCSPLOWO2_01_FULL_38_20]
MHAFLIIGQDEKLVSEQVTKLTKETKASPMEFPFEKISDVRDLQKFTKLSLAKKTAIILKNVDGASEEAQNAFLKNLEEPPKNLIYILTASNIDLIPETIISRCQVIKTSNFQFSISNEKTEITKKFLSSSVGKKLEIISKITKREEAIKFLTNFIKSSHALMLEETHISATIEEAMKTLKFIKSNGNVQLQLTRFVINT